MAVKIRLSPKGKKGHRFFHIVVVDVRAPRDGGKPEKVGTYDPSKSPAPVELKREAISSWLDKGAQATPTVRRILSSQGVLLRRHLQGGVSKGVITQKMADKHFAEWEKIASRKKRRPYLLPTPSTPAKAKVASVKESEDKAKPSTEKADSTEK